MASAGMINNEGVNEEDIGMEVQMDEEEAAMKAADVRNDRGLLAQLNFLLMRVD